MATIRELITKWGFDVDRTALDKVEKQFGGLQKAAKVMAATSYGALVSLATPAMMLQTKIRNAMTMTDVFASTEKLKGVESEMRDLALSISDQLNIANTEVAASFYDVLSAGEKAGSEGFKALDIAALKLSKLDDTMAPKQTVESLSDMTHAFGETAAEAERYANVIFKSTSQAATNAPQLIEAMKDAAPAGKALGQNVETVSAILNTFAQNGLKGGEAGTAFRAVMLRLSGAMPETRKALEKVGVSLFDQNGKTRNLVDVLYDLQKATSGMTDQQKIFLYSQIAGQEGFSKLQILMGANLELTKQWESELRNAGGTLDKAISVKESSWGKIKGLFNTLRNLATSLGWSLLEPIAKFFGFLNDNLKVFSKFVREHEKLKTAIVWILGITAAISTMIGVVFTLQLALVGIRSILAAINIQQTLIMLKTLGVALLAAAAIAIIVLAVQDLYGFLTGKYDSVLQHVVDNWDSAWGDNLGFFMQFIKLIGDGLKDALVGWQLIFQNFGEIISQPFVFLRSVLASLIDYFAKIGNWMSGSAAKLIFGAASKVAGVFGKNLDYKGFSEAVNNQMAANNAAVQNWSTNWAAKGAIEANAKNTAAMYNQKSTNNVSVNINASGLDAKQVAKEVDKQLSRHIDNSMANFKASGAY